MNRLRTQGGRGLTPLFQLIRAFSVDGDKPLTPLNKAAKQEPDYTQLVGYKNLHKRMKSQTEILERGKEQERILEKYAPSYLDDVYDLTIFFDPLDYNSQKSHAIFNYYKISYKRNMNKVWTERMRKQLKRGRLPNIDEFQFPAMKAVLNLEMDEWYFGEDQIFQYLLKHRMVGLMPHKSNTAWAHQGCEMIENKIVPPLATLFWSPMLNLELAFYGNTENFKISGKSYPGMLFAWLGLKKFLKAAFTGMPKILTRQKEYAEAKEKFLQGLKEFNGRLGNNPYHGGQQPDEADFLMLGVIKSRDICSSFATFLEEEMPKNMAKWLYRMEMNCKREEREMIH